MGETMRANIVGDTIFLAEDGEFELPVQTQLPHRLHFVDGAIIDRHPGLSDDEVRAWDAANPIVTEVQPVETPAPQLSVEEQLVRQKELNDAQQQQLDDLTMLYLEM